MVVTLGSSVKTIPILTEYSGIYLNIFNSSQNKLNQTFKIFRPLHHPPLKISLVPETKTKHTTPKDHRREVAMLKTQNLDPRQGSPSMFNRELTLESYRNRYGRRRLQKLFHPPLGTTLNQQPQTHIKHRTDPTRTCTQQPHLKHTSNTYHAHQHTWHLRSHRHTHR